MEEIDFEELYKIEKDKLMRYYERIKNQFRFSDPIKIVSKFLINQSIGSNFTDVHETLLYFYDKLAEGKEILDLAFEWIRAQKIRLEYKKYLIRAQYPNDSLSLAVDDCLFKFFLQYDNFMRNLLKNDVREHNFSALYEIFFSPYESKSLNIKDILERHIDNVPTHFQGIEKINTNIMILRSGLSVIIVKDYVNVLQSRREEKLKREQKFAKQKRAKLQQENNFEGLLLERMIKTFCISKKEISDKEIENAVSQFLSSYFKFGSLYSFEEFKELLIQNLAADIYSGLNERLKKKNKVDNIKYLILNIITLFRKTNTAKKLDGLAWKRDLTDILKTFVIKFLSTMFT
ncbi:hypothetical protein LCGC14_1111570 [marine sediment metagenome]|uniref:Uncharacterized protein n=1 Tax=marine sediment metagenome TaxID=412755 RepID=A0A0F9M6H5_9ZZZZ